MSQDEVVAFITEREEGEGEARLSPGMARGTFLWNYFKRPVQHNRGTLGRKLRTQAWGHMGRASNSGMVSLLAQHL